MFRGDSASASVSVAASVSVTVAVVGSPPPSPILLVVVVDCRPPLLLSTFLFLAVACEKKQPKGGRRS